MSVRSQTDRRSKVADKLQNTVYFVKPCVTSFLYVQGSPVKTNSSKTEDTKRHNRYTLRSSFLFILFDSVQTVIIRRCKTPLWPLTSCLSLRSVVDGVTAPSSSQSQVNPSYCSNTYKTSETKQLLRCLCGSVSSERGGAQHRGSREDEEGGSACCSEVRRGETENTLSAERLCHQGTSSSNTQHTIIQHKRQY